MPELSTLILGISEDFAVFTDCAEYFQNYTLLFLLKKAKCKHKLSIFNFSFEYLRLITKEDQQPPNKK